MDPEFADLIPVFLEEARDRVERLASEVPKVEAEEGALAVAKRELHTLKGAGRMLQLGAVSELCHAAEEFLLSERAPKVPLLTRVVDRLAAMVEKVAGEEVPEPDEELMALLKVPVEEEEGEEGEEGDGEGEAPEEGGEGDAPDEGEGGRTEEEGRGERATGEEPSEEPRAEGGEPAGGAPEPAAAPASRGARMQPARGEGGENGEAGPSAPLTSAEIRVDAAAIDKVADQATQMRIMALAANRLTERIYELARLAEDGIHEDKPTQVLAVLATMLRRVGVDLEGGQRRMKRAAETQVDGVLTLQVQPLRGYLLSLARHARELARSLGREVEVEIQGEDTHLDRRIARELDDALLHLVRNAVDHGIEGPELRRERGKPEIGRIRLAAEGSGSRVRLTIEDDGDGIRPDMVVRQAVEVGLIEPGAASTMEPEEIYQLLFAPGFSTRHQVSEISGRGVGLDVVAESVIRVGGEVFVDSEPGRGTRISMEVPLARRGEHVFLLKLGQVRMALPKGTVRRSRQLVPGQVVERGGRVLARFEDDELVPFVPLSRVYGQPAAESQLLLEGEISGQRFAVAVDEVEGEEEVLVRPVPRSVDTDRLLEGVALLASGEPVGVLSPPMLAQRELLRTGRKVPRVQKRAAVRVLLVDDSLVTREMERRLLEDAGFDVTAAGDAEEALSILGEHDFDCVVTDIEMPGMDGFELTEQLRNIEHLEQLPIIVVSTRDRPEDRLRGLKAGADAYLTKQSLDAGELVDLVRRLSGA